MEYANGEVLDEEDFYKDLGALGYAGDVDGEEEFEGEADEFKRSTDGPTVEPAFLS